MSCGPLVPFDLYWVKRNGKKVLLKNAGSFSKKNDIQKLIDKELNLECDFRLSESFLNGFISLFVRYLEEQRSSYPHPAKIQEWRLSFLNWMAPIIWEDRESISDLDIAFAVGAVFYQVSDELENDFLSFPLEVQARNYTSAAFAVLFAMCLGYDDFNFLKDYYTTLLFMDYPFLVDMWSENEYLFLLQERKLPGLGESLSSGVKKKVIKRYANLNSAGIEKICNEIDNKGLVNYLKWSFERVNGTGFPKGLNQREMSDLDMITIFSYQAFDLIGKINSEPERKLFKNYLNLKTECKSANLGIRFERVLNTAFAKAQEKDGGFLEIVGL